MYFGLSAANGSSTWAVEAEVCGSGSDYFPKLGKDVLNMGYYIFFIVILR